MQLILTVFKSKTISRIDDPNKSVRVLKVIAPVGANGRLATNIPEIKLTTRVFHCLDLESERGSNLRRVFTEELFEYCGFTRVVKS